MTDKDQTLAHYLLQELGLSFDRLEKKVDHNAEQSRVRSEFLSRGLTTLNHALNLHMAKEEGRLDSLEQAVKNKVSEDEVKLITGEHHIIETKKENAELKENASKWKWVIIAAVVSLTTGAISATVSHIWTRYGLAPAANAATK